MLTTRVAFCLCSLLFRTSLVDDSKHILCSLPNSREERFVPTHVATSQHEDVVGNRSHLPSCQTAGGKRDLCKQANMLLEADLIFSAKQQGREICGNTFNGKSSTHCWRRISSSLPNSGEGRFVPAHLMASHQHIVGGRSHLPCQTAGKRDLFQHM